MVALIGFGGGDGGSVTTFLFKRCCGTGGGELILILEWVKRHSSPFLQRSFKKNLHNVLLTRWCGAVRCDGFGLGDLNLRGELHVVTLRPGPGCDASPIRPRRFFLFFVFGAKP